MIERENSIAGLALRCEIDGRNRFSRYEIRLDLNPWHPSRWDTEAVSAIRAVVNQNDLPGLSCELQNVHRAAGVTNGPGDVGVRLAYLVVESR
jgi:hypothetical protein